MKNGFLLYLMLVLASCKEGAKGDIDKQGSTNIQQAGETKMVQQQNPVSWIQALRDFREALYQQDRKKVKTFIDFPIMNEGNEIWYLVENGNIASDTTIHPFTEKDFDRYYEKLFSTHFINALLKVKTQVLYKKGEVETIELKDGKATTYRIYATFDKADHLLSLNLASNTVTKDENGEVQDGGEFSILYQFKVMENGQLKFKQVQLAG